MNAPKRYETGKEVNERTVTENGVTKTIVETITRYSDGSFDK